MHNKHVVKSKTGRNKKKVIETERFFQVITVWEDWNASFLLLFFMVLEMKPRTLHLLSRYSAIEPYCQHCVAINFFKVLRKVLNF